MISRRKCIQYPLARSWFSLQTTSCGTCGLLSWSGSLGTIVAPVQVERSISDARGFSSLCWPLRWIALPAPVGATGDSCCHLGNRRRGKVLLLVHLDVRGRASASAPLHGRRCKTLLLRGHRLFSLRSRKHGFRATDYVDTNIADAAKHCFLLK